MENYAYTLVNDKTYGIKACLRKNQKTYENRLTIRKVLIKHNMFEVGGGRHADGTPFSADRDGPILALDYILEKLKEKGIIQKTIYSDGHGYLLQV